MAKQIDEVWAQAVKDHFQQCREDVPGFVKSNFRYPGAWHLNKHALGWDMLKAPLNLLWALPYLALQLLALLLGLLKAEKFALWLRKAPSGFETSVQNEISWLIATDLLKLPIQQKHRQSDDDALWQRCTAALNDEFDLDEKILAPRLAAFDNLHQYSETRNANADIANSLFATIAGALSFKKFTPGGLAVGGAVANEVAQQQAISGFWLGETMGGVWYGWFPAQASEGLTALSVGLTMVVFAVVASFSGLLTDPLQAWLSLHQRRLNKLIDALEASYLDNVSDYKPKDGYLARLGDVLDWVRGGAQSLL